MDPFDEAEPANALVLEPKGEEGASGCHDEEFTSLLGLEPTEQLAETSVRLGEDCLPVGIVAEAVEATAHARAEAVRRQGAELARDVLARAEQEVRELLSHGLPEAEFATLSAEIVARADREVRQILARGRNDAEVVEMRAGHQAAGLCANAAALASTPLDAFEPSETTSEQESERLVIHPELEPWTEPGVELTLVEPEAPAEDAFVAQSESAPASATDEQPVEVLVPAQAIVQMSGGRSSSEPCFATLRAVPLPTNNGVVQYRVHGSLTFATMLAFEEAVARLPGVSSASVTPEPDDVATLKLATSDPSLIPPLLVCLPGIQLQIEAA